MMCLCIKTHIQYWTGAEQVLPLSGLWFKKKIEKSFGLGKEGQ